MTAGNIDFLSLAFLVISVLLFLSAVLLLWERRDYINDYEDGKVEDDSDKFKKKFLLMKRAALALFGAALFFLWMFATTKGFNPAWAIIEYCKTLF